MPVPRSGPNVTASRYANGIRFIKPIKVVQLVEITASLVHTGASSMHIYVVVKSGDATENTTSFANSCFITFMAVHAKDFAKQLDSDFTENIEAFIGVV